MFTLDKIRKYLDRPHPRLLAQKYGWLYLAAVAIFIACIVNHLQPYGLDDWHHPLKWIILSCFGLIFVVIYIFIHWLLPLIFPHFFTLENWTIRKEAMALCLIFFVDSAANWGFALAEISYSHASAASFLRFHFYTMELGILPMVAFSLLAWYSDISRYIPDFSRNRALPPAEILFTFNRLVFDLNKVLYISKFVNSLQFHVFQEGQCMIRECPGTIKQLLLELKDYPQLQQTHESFVVNIDWVKNLQGNSNSMNIGLKDCPDIISVSRHFIPQIQQLFLGRPYAAGRIFRSAFASRNGDKKVPDC